MDLISFNLEGLQRLHLAYNDVEENLMKQLADVEVNDSDQETIELLKIKMTKFQGGIQKITQRSELLRTKVFLRRK